MIVDESKFVKPMLYMYLAGYGTANPYVDINTKSTGPYYYDFISPNFTSMVTNFMSKNEENKDCALIRENDNQKFKSKFKKALLDQFISIANDIENLISQRWSFEDKTDKTDQDKFKLTSELTMNLRFMKYLYSFDQYYDINLNQYELIGKEWQENIRILKKGCYTVKNIIPIEGMYFYPSDQYIQEKKISKEKEKLDEIVWKSRKDIVTKVEEYNWQEMQGNRIR